MAIPLFTALRTVLESDMSRFTARQEADLRTSATSNAKGPSMMHCNTVLLHGCHFHSKRRIQLPEIGTDS